MHDSGHSYIIAIHTITQVDVSYLARRYFTNARKMRGKMRG